MEGRDDGPDDRSAITVSRRAGPGGQLVVRLRPLQAPAVLRRLAQGLRILAGQVHHRRSPEDVAVRLQAQRQQAVLLRLAQEAGYFVDAVQRPAWAFSLRKLPSVLVAG